MEAKPLPADSVSTDELISRRRSLLLLTFISYGIWCATCVINYMTDMGRTFQPGARLALEMTYWVSWIAWVVSLVSRRKFARYLKTHELADRLNDEYFRELRMKSIVAAFVAFNICEVLILLVNFVYPFSAGAAALIGIGVSSECFMGAFLFFDRD